MIRSMTAYGSARAESALGTVTVELRTVNSRFLDVNLRLPDELRGAEGVLRDKLGQTVKRGKVDIRVSYQRAATAGAKVLDPAYLEQVARQLATARAVLPDTASPTLAELLRGADDQAADWDTEAWQALCLQAGAQALAELQANREREGARLAAMMRDCATAISDIVVKVEQTLPVLLAEHREKLATRLREALDAANPGGYAQITGAELSARIAQESTLHALKVDVAEELARLRSHVQELEHLLQGAATAGSIGKRLDFLFQEMNREANTLGSKSGGLHITRAAMDLKLLIEQLREQAQNIE